MKSKYFFVLMLISSILLFVGCKSKSEANISNTEGEDDKVIEVAWNFVVDNGWENRAVNEWQRADVGARIADDKYILIDSIYKGKEVLAVSFKEDLQSVLGVPIILVDPKSYKVIGYMPVE